MEVLETKKEVKMSNCEAWFLRKFYQLPEQQQTYVLLTLCRSVLAAEARRREQQQLDGSDRLPAAEEEAQL